MKTPFTAITLMAIASIPSVATAQQLYNHGNPTVSEQLMLEQVNRARANPNAEAARFGIGLNDSLVPGSISSAPKAPLAFNPKLIQSARAHSQWMVNTDIFDHTGVNGSTAQQRMSAAGYVFSGPFPSGENIAQNGTSGTLDPAATTLELHKGLFKSSGHRLNICENSYNEIGIGIIQGSFRGFNSLLATQNFASSSASQAPFLLGVIFQDADGDGIYDSGEGIPGVTITPVGGAWNAVSSDSGGYAVPVTGTGSITVTFSGRGLTTDLTRTVQLTGANVKLDYIIPASATLTSDGLTRNGLPPEIEVNQPRKTSLKSRKGVIDFGSTAARKKRGGKVRRFFITNSGKGPLDVQDVVANGRNSRDFIIRPLSSSTIAPGATTVLRVTFRPLSKGGRRAILRIKNNDSNEGIFNIRVRGTGR